MSLKSFSDIIAAISTPIGRGGIAVIRLSGSGCFDIAKQLTTIKNPIKNTIKFSVFKNETGEIIDEGLVSFFESPNSFTGEDIVEFNCHGGYVVAKKLLSVIFEQGARQASSGEFSMRAFVNGKMDLVQAESIVDLIDSKTNKSAELAAHNLHGELSDKLQLIRKKLLDFISHLEVHLDYPDEEELEESPIYELTISGMQSEIDVLLATYDAGRIYNEGVVTAIIGKPNSGKSSLLNVLLQEERAIVSDIPGTTRDTIEEWMQLQGIPFRIVDTAGIREAMDAIEEIGVNKSKEYIETAELVLWLFDASEFERVDLEMIPSKFYNKIIPIVNKTDLASPSLIERKLLEMGMPKPVNISLTEGTGIESLIESIVEHVETRYFSENDDACLANERQRDQLMKASKLLSHAMGSVKSSMPVDTWVIDLREALMEVSEVVGQNISEEVLDNIFSRFCVGK